MKNLESGRSMVEMLGVLAIIGVLSVGGIGGYALSMRRHRANGVADTVSKYALVAYNHCQQRMLNGEVDSLENCTFENTPYFVDSGIGNMPSGLGYIAFSGIAQDQETGSDTVYFEAYFEDQKLCETTGSIAGSECEKKYTNKTPTVEFKIKREVF